MGRIKPLNEVKRPEWAEHVNVDEYMKKEREEMTEAAKQARREYKREWNRKNKDRVKAAQIRYWEKRARITQEQTDAQEDENTP